MKHSHAIAFLLSLAILAPMADARTPKDATAKERVNIQDMLIDWEGTLTAPPNATAASSRSSSDTSWLRPTKEPAPTSDLSPTVNGAPDAGEQTRTTPRLTHGMLIDLTVFVAGEKEIEQIAKRIGADGFIRLPLLGRVKAAGKTLAEFRKELWELYNRDYLVNPSVTVDFSSDADEYASPWGYVTVLGAVKNPGKVNIPPTQDLTLSKAVQEAGGCTAVAKLSSIRISRKGKDGKAKVTKVDLHDIGAKGRMEDDLRLRPKDIIYVPETIL